MELGINHIGEMERLARAVSPDIAVLTNAEHAHVGLFGDRKTLVREKLTIARELRSGGHLILPIQLQSERLPCPREQCIAFGRGGEFAAENIRNSENAVALDLRTPFRVITNLTWPLPGEIGVAVVEILGAVGALCGLEDDEIRKGILRAGERPLRQRAQVLAGRLIVDDCYNASPEATVRALETLTLRAGDRALVAVLGDMLELGDESEYWHVLVGKRVAALGFSKLFVYGTLSPMIAKGAIEAGMAEQSVRVFSMAEQVDLVDAICRECPPNAAILFKASGAMCMGRVLGAVKEEWA